MDLFHPAFVCHRDFYEQSVVNFKELSFKFPDSGIIKTHIWERAKSLGFRPEFCDEVAYG